MSKNDTIKLYVILENDAKILKEFDRNDVLNVTNDPFTDSQDISILTTKHGKYKINMSMKDASDIFLDVMKKNKKDLLKKNAQLEKEAAQRIIDEKKREEAFQKSGAIRFSKN